MEERSSKIYFGFCMLVLVWIGVYWAWDPGVSANPRISVSLPVEPPVEVLSDPEPTETETTNTNQPPAEILPPIDQPPRLIPPEFKTHTIKEGEIMQDIAVLYYGKSSMWSVIARANPRIDPLKLRQGMTLRIPIDPNNIQGRVETPGDSNTETNQVQDTNTTVEYIVQPGDSLSRIAQNYYGSARHADFIFQSNRDTLRSMDSIRVGQTLKLPPLDP